MDELVSRFDALRSKIKQDYDVYVDNLPVIITIVDDFFIKDISRSISQYLQPHPEGEGIFELRIYSNNTLRYGGWELWIHVSIEQGLNRILGFAGQNQ
jgi:hypothetical protein